MKRGKEEEKTMGPMFPRLHVNDTAEKGGPRAPPRNKMALYEQVSIPSQRFGSGLVPLNPQNNANMASSASSSQANSVDRNVFPRLSGSTTTPWSEKFHAQQPDGTNETVSVAPFEQRNKVGDEDDFTVPVFVQAKVTKSQSKIQNSTDRETVSSISSTHSGQLAERRNTLNAGPKQNPNTNFGQEVRNERNINTKSSGQDEFDMVISSTNQSTEGNVDDCVEEGNMSSLEQCRGNVVSNFGSSSDGEACLHKKSRVEAQTDSYRRDENLVESTRDTPRSNNVKDHGKPRKPENHSAHNNSRKRTCISLQFESVDKEDDDSETSMVDSVSGLDITPDEVVGIIGQKHFWKARKAIVHQQRVFAVQVFELHKLIKIQRLIAGSPHILLEDSAFLGKSTLEGYPAKNLQPEFAAEPLPAVASSKDDSDKSSHKKERSTENTVAKTSGSSANNSGQPMNYGPYMGHPQPMNDNQMGPWSFHQPPGPQWLVPVMSPSEGLVYKPYPGPLPLALYGGGFGPFGPNPVNGNYTNSAYGGPASQPQGIAGFGQTYFPYMPIPNPAMSGSAVDQASQFSGPGSDSQTGPVAAAEKKGSSTAPTQKNEPVSQAKKLQASKGNDLQQRSTASSSCEISEARDSLTLFPLAPGAQEGNRRPQLSNQQTRVVKVVPHNRRSATESAARIFRFIQEERKQLDSA